MQHRELHSLEKINIIRQLPSIPEDRLRTLGRCARRPFPEKICNCCEQIGRAFAADAWLYGQERSGARAAGGSAHVVDAPRWTVGNRCMGVHAAL